MARPFTHPSPLNGPAIKSWFFLYALPWFTFMEEKYKPCKYSLSEYRALYSDKEYWNGAACIYKKMYCINKCVGNLFILAPFTSLQADNFSHNESILGEDTYELSYHYTR